MKTKFQKVLIAVGTIVLSIFLMQIKIEWPQSAQSAPELSKYWNDKSSRRSDSKASVEIDMLNRTFTELNDALSQSVVNIYTTSRVASQNQREQQFGGSDELFEFFFGNPFNGGPGRGMRSVPPPQQEASSLGSGFVIHESGLIITNSHVVRPTGKNADSVRVKFLSDPEKSEGHPAEILGVDETTDVAVIRIKAKVPGMKVAPLGDSDKTKVGEWVMAIGNPYGHTHSVTKGIVSALGRNISEGLPTLQRADFIQTDASINPGNSGGPLFNLYGEVIGINTAIDARAQGIGFAIPINIAKSVIGQIVEKGSVTLGWIGVTIIPMNPKIAQSLGMKNTNGVLIQDTIPGEPAEKAGFKSYDVIIEANGSPIETDRDFQRLVAGAPVGTELHFKVLREGKTVALKAKVGARPSTDELAKRAEDRGADSDERGVTIEKAGIQVVDLDTRLRSMLRLPGTINGAVIGLVAEGSPAASIGLRVGDLITKVDTQNVSNARQAQAALSAKKKQFLLKIQRRSASLIVFLDLSN